MEELENEEISMGDGTTGGESKFRSMLPQWYSHVDLEGTALKEELQKLEQTGASEVRGLG